MPGDFDTWIGRHESAEDIITHRQTRQMAATLDTDAPGNALPSLWHWIGWRSKKFVRRRLS